MRWRLPRRGGRNSGMASPYPIRPATEDDLLAVSAVHEHAFHTGPPSSQVRERLDDRIEYDRTFVASDGGTIAGTTGSFGFRMRVPGALAAVAGVTLVGVLPTYRRRGILSSLMRWQLDDLYERGEAVAALFASEAVIYSRFGYGRASWQAGYSLRAGEGELAAGAPTDGSLRLRIAEPRAARPELAKVYEAVLGERPGFFARNETWWDRALADDPDRRAGASPLRCVLAEDTAGPRGYALFSGRERWDQDALLHLLADPRRVRSRVTDALWVRLVDVAGALVQRRYACPVDVVIEVTDDGCGWNRGRWRLTTGAAGPPAPGTGAVAGFRATCERTTGPADIALPVQALGAAYLGGTRLGPMAAAGLVAELRPGALAALSAALSWDPAPWCPMMF